MSFVDPWSVLPATSQLPSQPATLKVPLLTTLKSVGEAENQEKRFTPAAGTAG